MSLRWIPNIEVDRPRVRMNLAYRATQRLSVALEWNPLADEVLPNFNYSPSLPGEHVKGLGAIFGLSSDRIGTPHGFAWFGTVSWNARAWTELPLSGYVGASFGSYEDELRPIAGATWSIYDRASGGFIHDGENLHWILSYGLGELGPGHALWQADLLVIEQDDSRTLGATISTRF